MCHRRYRSCSRSHKRKDTCQDVTVPRTQRPAQTFLFFWELLNARLNESANTGSRKHPKPSQHIGDCSRDGPVDCNVEIRLLPVNGDHLMDPGRQCDTRCRDRHLVCLPSPPGFRNISVIFESGLP